MASIMISPKRAFRYENARPQWPR